MVDTNNRKTKSGESADDYTKKYMNIGAPAATFQFFCQAISEVLVGGVGPSKVPKKDGHYWITINFTEPEDFVFKIHVQIRGSNPPRYRQSKMEQLDAEVLLGPTKDSHLAIVFMTMGVSYTSARDECPTGSDIPAHVKWVLTMKVAGCHLMLKRDPTVNVASNVANKVC